MSNGMFVQWYCLGTSGTLVALILGPLNWNTSRLLRSFHSLILFVYSRPASKIYTISFRMPLPTGLFCGFAPFRFAQLHYEALPSVVLLRYRPFWAAVASLQYTSLEQP